MGSELVSFAPPPLLEGDRGSRAGVGAREGSCGLGGAGGPRVSGSPLRSFESMVAAVFRSREPPHVEQNRPFEATCAPQEEQYMGGAILPFCEGSPRTDAAVSDESYEMRSTSTAVPYANTSVTPCMTSVAS
jgi:hypothetical protein